MEENEKAGWFHCGRCGALFGAEVGGGVPAQCPECGRDPVIDHSEIAFAQAAETPVQKAADNGSSAGGDGSQRRGEKKRKKGRSGLFTFVGIWVVLLLLLAGAVKYFRGSVDLDDDELGFGIVSENDSLLNEEINECKRKVVDFFEAGAPERRARLVVNPVENLRRMAGQQQDILSYVPGEDPSRTISHVMDTPKGKAIETVWDFNGGRRVEATFFSDEEGEWKIDWANMVRYSDKEWPLFLVGTGEEEGEFRLLVRRRSEDRSGMGKVASVVLIGPRPSSPGELGAPSPEVVVDPDSRIGRILSEAFAKRDAGDGIYGSKASSFDPNGMIRLRVKVLREAGNDRSFVIREILACHWYDFDDLGLSE